MSSSHRNQNPIITVVYCVVYSSEVVTIIAIHSEPKNTTMMRLSFLLSLLAIAESFMIVPSSVVYKTKTTALQDGTGVAKEGYSWWEDPTEVEVKFQVSSDVKQKDVLFQAKPLSVDLRLQTDNYIRETQSFEQITLMNITRRLRGKVDIDGTYWDIEDVEGGGREITVTIEKNIPPAKDDFEIIDYDWGGVYPDEVALELDYPEPEALNVREYAAKLGVDIDNINMSMVDKSLFSSGLNMTRNTMDQLAKNGLAQEVTQQGDGTEMITDEDGNSVPFDRLGEGISNDEIKQSDRIPFLDTDSPFQTAKPAYNFDELLKGLPDSDNDDKAPRQELMDKIIAEQEAEAQQKMNDPIDHLPKDRLMEILKGQGLDTHGDLTELQQRLKNHVQSQVAGQQQQE